MNTNRSALLVAALPVIAISAATFGAIEPRDQLKTYFQTGDVPTQEQFSVVRDPAHLDRPDFIFTRGDGSTHFLEGVNGAEFLTDGAGHPLFLTIGDSVRPTSGQFGTLIDSSLNLIDDRYLIGLRFTRDDGVHYGFLDISIDSPLAGWPDYYALTIHGWAFETEPNTPITAFSIPTPGTAAMLGLSAVGAARRRRRPE